MTPAVSIAIPVRNAGPGFAAVLDAIAAQSVRADFEIVVIDSASTDGSAELARARGARVAHIVPSEFSHGGTRNRLMELARGDHVAFLTQDAEPAHPGWLAALLAGFDAAPAVALTFGPYLPRPAASPMVRRELEEWFALMAPLVHRPDGPPTPGPEGFFSDVNGAVARWAWEEVPYRRVPYAEDRVLAAEMLARGWGKAYRAGAGVLHSHDYPPVALARRAFDEARALREVYGHLAPAPRMPWCPAARIPQAASRGPRTP